MPPLPCPFQHLPVMAISHSPHPKRSPATRYLSPLRGFMGQVGKPGIGSGTVPVLDLGGNVDALSGRHLHGSFAPFLIVAPASEGRSASVRRPAWRGGCASCSGSPVHSSHGTPEPARWTMARDSSAPQRTVHKGSARRWERRPLSETCPFFVCPEASSLQTSFASRNTAQPWGQPPYIVA